MAEIQNNVRESDNPILNNPYEEPRFHYDAYTNGNLDYSKVLEGRRPYTSILSVTPSGQQSPEIFGASDFDDADPNAWFINHIREVVGNWRNSSYAGATRVTRELLNFWFNNPERAFRHRLFFCQREAVETAVYLNEIADRDPNIGRSILNELEERRNTVSVDSDYVLPRTAFKMATGTGKTVVMAMFILYNYLNKKEYPTDTRFADHFLLVAPGITIRDRLGVLFIDDSSKWVNDKEDYYHVRQLIPSVYEHQLGGLNAAITITNYHQFEPKVYSGKKASPMDGKMVYKETQVDILVTPAVVIISGVLMAYLAGAPIQKVMTALGTFIENATQMQPLLMGIVVSVVIGSVLTLPISSAAICLAIGLGGIAGGAATAGCCAQMIGFAVLSFRENRWGGLVAQGLGTSMLQMGNIVKNPKIWIPVLLTSAITGPISTCIFHLENIPIGSGMGTCGLVGPIGIYTAMPEGGMNMWIGMALVCFVLPAVLTWIFGLILRKIGWIKEGDLKIDC